MKIISGILLVGGLMGVLHYLGFIGTPTAIIDAAEIEYLESLPLEPIHQSMSVAKAYLAIPHNQVTYRADGSTLKRDEAAYLEDTFFLVDRAVVERVTLLQSLQRNDRQKRSLDNYNQILKRLIASSVPRGMEFFHQQIIAAIQEEKQYFRGFQESSSVFTLNRWDPLLLRPHRRLVASYEFLMSQYPQETTKNRQAFFEHLCALDFL